MGADVVADYRRARRMLGVVPQELVFDPFFSVRETLRIQSGYFGIRGNDAWIDEVMHHLDLTAKADANMRALSGGMKRRVLVAQALVHKPPVIVLDEPTAGVDVELRQGLWQFIAAPEPRRPHHRAHHALPGGGRGAVQPHRHAEGRAASSRSTRPRNLLKSFSGLQLKLRLDRERLPRRLAGRASCRSDGVHVRVKMRELRRGRGGAASCCAKPASASSSWSCSRPTSRTCSCRSRSQTQ